MAETDAHDIQAAPGSEGAPTPTDGPRATTRRVGRLLALVLSVVVALVAHPATSGASGSFGFTEPAVVTSTDAETAAEREFVQMVNALRRARGRSELQPAAELETGAEIWTEQLRVDGGLSHATDLSVGVTSHWLKLGENVGVAPADEVEALFEAFVASPTHLANLVDPDFTHIGVVVQIDADGRMWTTHRFMQLESD